MIVSVCVCVLPLRLVYTVNLIKTSKLVMCIRKLCCSSCMCMTLVGGNSRLLMQWHMVAHLNAYKRCPCCPIPFLSEHKWTSRQGSIVMTLKRQECTHAIRTRDNYVLHTYYCKHPRATSIHIYIHTYRHIHTIVLCISYGMYICMFVWLGHEEQFIWEFFSRGGRAKLFEETERVENASFYSKFYIAVNIPLGVYSSWRFNYAH